MEYKNIVQDFAIRTRKNLELLRAYQKEHPEEEVYEVTQLINSMLGLLVFPKESFFNRIPPIPISTLFDQGWPVPKVVGDYSQAKDFKEIIRYLRNAIAHKNLEFKSNEHGHIEGLYVWNKVGDQITWKAELSLEDIEGITNRLIEILTSNKIIHHNSRPKITPQDKTNLWP